MRCSVLLVSVVLLLGMPRSAHARWGTDINAGAGPRLIEDVAPALARIVAAPAADRAALVSQAVVDYGLAGIEAIKRFRNPELKPLFLALARHQDWTVRHRALYALEYFGGSDALEAALSNLGHEQRRLRERAAIACIKLWDGRQPCPEADARWAVEEDLHVRRCLEALAMRRAGKLHVERVYVEHVETRPDGLELTPFLSGMNNASNVAPGYKSKTQARQGGGSAAKLPPADRWVRPLLGYGDEVVQGTSLQPFANLRQNGTVYHTGHDVGASMDGAGYYASAEGIVKLVHSGSDMGTLIVVEHHVGGKAVVNGVYMHGGDTVFVKAGERVASGQLLGTMGMSYSIENGGHYAHLHYGMYPGPFSMTHNYGYKPVSAGLTDWYDPAAFLAAWCARTEPVVPDLPLAAPALSKARSLLAKGLYGAAYAEVLAVRDGAGEPGRRLREGLEHAPQVAAGRVERLRADGFPGEALRMLGTFATALEGIPGAESLALRLMAWKKDADLKVELKAEKAFESTRKKAGKAKDAAQARALWEKLLAKSGGTPVDVRIRAELERL